MTNMRSIKLGEEVIIISSKAIWGKIMRVDEQGDAFVQLPIIKVPFGTFKITDIITEGKDTKTQCLRADI